MQASPSLALCALLAACGAKTGLIAPCNDPTINGRPCRIRHAANADGYPRFDPTAPECGGARCIAARADTDDGFCSCACDHGGASVRTDVPCPNRFVCGTVEDGAYCVRDRYDESCPQRLCPAPLLVAVRRPDGSIERNFTLEVFSPTDRFVCPGETAGDAVGRYCDRGAVDLYSHNSRAFLGAAPSVSVRSADGLTWEGPLRDLAEPTAVPNGVGCGACYGEPVVVTLAR